MSRFERASHVIWHCQYHLVWVPKYRFRTLQGPIRREVQRCLMTFCQQLGCQIVEMNVQLDHVHPFGERPPRVSIAEPMGVLKGRNQKPLTQ
jgi:putative transposase